MKRFTLHIRLTKRCSASCSYCSSWQEEAIPYMKPADFTRAMEFLSAEVLPLLGHGRETPPQPGHASLQYVGGEILTIPRKILRECVYSARDIMGRHFTDVTDGVQSNLIGNDKRLRNLHTLFGKRIGTSVDHFSDQRKLGGSAELYRAAANKGRAALQEKRGFNPPSIFVVDQEGLANLDAEIGQAEAKGYDLTLRPVFAGGSDIAAAEKADLADKLGKAAADWVMQSDIRIEPFYKLATSRVATVLQDEGMYWSAAGCPFQRNCAQVSLDLEPNGDIFICLDMADSGQYRLGNALEGKFDRDVWQQLASRQEHLDSKCQSCKWRPDCQGGCMSEAIHHTGSIHGRTELCSTWEAIFAVIDRNIEKYGATAMRDWLENLASTPETRKIVA